NFQGSATPSTTTQDVQQTSTKTTLSSSANPTSFGNDVVITATVAPTAPGGGIPVGTITFVLDGNSQAPVALSSGKATLTLTQPSRGSHSVLAIYSGNADYVTSSSTTLNEIVTDAATSISVSA